MAYSEATAAAICEQLAEGKSLRAACVVSGIKHPTFLLWVSESPALADHYARSRAHGRELRFERLREISAAEPERDDKGKIDPGWVQWKRLEVDTEKWSLAREDAKKYGEKLAIGGADDLPPIRTMSDEQLIARAKALQDKLNAKPD